jgi:hypothetical protein
MEEKNEKKIYKYSKEKVHEYNQNFYDKVKRKTILCDICLQEYKYYNKSYHMTKSKLHQMALKIKKTTT